MFRGDTSGSCNRGELGSSSIHREKRQKIDSAKEKAPTLEKLIFTKIEQGQVKQNNLSLKQWKKLLDLDPVREWLKSEQGASWIHTFVETKVGEAWYKAKGEQWLESDNGQAHLRNHIHTFIETEVGEAWYKAKGKQWLESDNGQAYLRNHIHTFVETKVGKAWFKGKMLYKARGERWLESDNGQAHLRNHIHTFIETEVGEAWYKAKGKQWLESDNGQAYLRNHIHTFINTEIGQEWFKSEDGKKYMKRTIPRHFLHVFQASQ